MPSFAPYSISVVKACPLSHFIYKVFIWTKSNIVVVVVVVAVVVVVEVEVVVAPAGAAL